jgi:hypothetical protein
MVTLRTYSNAAEAAMAKSLLDNHDIFCRLADENVHLYGGGPLAMPIRLLGAEDQAQEAARILETKGPALSEYLWAEEFVAASLLAREIERSTRPTCP